MTPQDLAELHKAAFAPARGWSADEISRLCETPHVRCFSAPDAFALVRSLAGEAELLTLAVHPGARRKGHAQALMRRWLDAEAANMAFLEVAADNAPARALYEKLGFAESGRRKAYYKRYDGVYADAVLMQLALPLRNATETPSKPPKTG